MARKPKDQDKQKNPPRDSLGRYGKVYYRMWTDAGFQALSKPQPNGQSLWQYLLTCPRRSSVPGLVIGRERDFAESLEWSIEGFRESFQELFDMGMANADWTVGLVWLPQGFRYNRPENQNVVTGWRFHWEEIPECILKVQAWQALRTHVEQLGPRFLEQFDIWVRKPSEKGLDTRLPNQEQEHKHKHKQEQKEEALPPLQAFSEYERGGVGERVSQPPTGRRRPPGATAAPPQAELLEPPKPDPKGSRLPDDWKLSPEWLAEAVKLGMADDDAKREAERFRDYWVAAPTAKARKADWLATWRNWIRTTLERRSGNGSAGPARAPAPLARKPKSLEEQLAEDGM
jgi:hypothetical protein